MSDTRPCVALLVPPGDALPSWIVDTAVALRELGAALVLAGTGSREVVQAPPARGWSRRLYDRLDAARYPLDREPWRTESERDGSEFLRLGAAHGLTRAELEDALRHCEPAVIVDLTGSADPALGALATGGLWRIESAIGTADLDAIGARETVDASGLVSLALVSYQRGQRATLDTTSFRPDPFSVRRTRAHVLLEASRLIARAMKRRIETPEVASPNTELLPPPGPVGEPRASVSGWALARVVRRWTARQLVARTADEQWILAYRSRGPGGPLADWQRAPGDEWSLVIPPADRFWADPFVVGKGDHHVILFEEYAYQERKGCISVLEVTGGVVTAPRRVLERDYHLSYPFTFEYGGDYFMIPETAEQRRVELYRARDFPHGWERVRVLLEGEALVDPTLAQIGDQWWLFAGSAELDGRLDNELHVFAADTPFGPFRPHPRNPVLVDVRSARPAGALIEHDGTWYRPAQDGTHTYGYGLTLRRIVRLDAETYAEQEVVRFGPTWARGLTGTHTWNSAGGLTVIDGRRLRRRPWRHWGPSGR